MLRVNALRRSGFVHFSALVSLAWACSGPEASTGPSAQGGSAGASPEAGAADQGGEGASPQAGGSSNGGSAVVMDGGAAGEGQAAGAGGAAGGAGGAADQPECTEAGDCQVPDTTPAGCAEATCNEGKCELSAKDADGDGFIAKRCQSLDPNVSIPTGDDCDDADKNTNPEGWDGPAGDGHANGCNDQIDQDCSGVNDDEKLAGGATCTCSPNDTEPCATTASGLPINFPVLVNEKPVGECKLGSRQCLPNGTWGECTNAIAPTHETCDKLDNDCDSLYDEDPSDPKHFYCDADNDGYLALAAPVQIACEHSGPCTGGWLQDPAPGLFTDCDDTDPKNYPGPVKQEVCDGGDNNCDGIIDGKITTNDLKTVFYQDADKDTFGTDASATLACKAPAATGWVPTGGDCVDTGAKAIEINPNAAEVCNGKDDDCDGDVDTADSNLIGQPSSPGTTYACQGGQWVIVGCPAGKLDCDGGATCEADVGAMTSCHACNTSCYFDCGSVGCNEVVDLAAGFGHGCAVAQEGDAWCWGLNDKGQLGDTSKTTRNNPVLVSGLSDVKRIGTGVRHTCAVVGSTNALYCWGNNGTLQLGPGVAGTESQTAVSVSLGGVVSMGLGDGHSCAVTNDHKLRCWGRNDFGQLGNGDDVFKTNVALPSIVIDKDSNDVTNATQVAAGAQHACALLTDKTVVCWGHNDSLQLGRTGGDSFLALAVAGLTNVTQVAAGDSYNCALAAGKVFCWGLNDNLQLGVAGAGPFSAPQQVPALTDAIAVSAGYQTTCVIRSGGAVECWGGNASGARGDAPGAGTTTRKVVGVTQVAKLSLGVGEQACALRSTGDAYCWGNNATFQLGKTGANTNIPQLLIE